MDKSLSTLQAEKAGKITYICDTNFILRYIVGDNASMLAKATTIFNQIKNDEIEAIIEPEVFTEVVFVLSSFYDFSRQKITKGLISLLGYRGFTKHHELYTEALTLYDTNNKLSIVDCLLATRSRSANIQLLSFDKALLKEANQ